VSTVVYQVENGNEYRLGDTEEYYYDTTEDWQKLYGDRDSDIPGSAILSQGC